MRPPPAFIVPFTAAVAIVLGVACAASTPSDPELARGKQIYDNSCAVCHGSEGQGDTAPRLIGIATTSPDINKEIAVITNGTAGTRMPGWKSSYSADEIAAVAKYTRTLK